MAFWWLFNGIVTLRSREFGGLISIENKQPPMTDEPLPSRMVRPKAMPHLRHLYDASDPPQWFTADERLMLWTDAAGRKHREDDKPAVVDLVTGKQEFWFRGAHYDTKAWTPFRTLRDAHPRFYRSTPCTALGILQAGSTCYVAAALNCLLCTPTLRNFVTKVLNQELTAQRVSATAFAAGSARGASLRTDILRLFARRACGGVDHGPRDITNASLAIERTLLPREKDTGHGGQPVAVAMEILHALGLQVAHTRRGPDDKILKLGARLWEDVPDVVFVVEESEAQTERVILSRTEELYPGTLYELVCGMLVLESHVSACVICPASGVDNPSASDTFRQQARVFDSNVGELNLDWVDGHDLFARVALQLGDLLEGRVAMYVSRPLYMRNQRPVRCLPTAAKVATPLHARLATTRAEFNRLETLISNGSAPGRLSRTAMLAGVRNAAKHVATRRKAAAKKKRA